MIYNYILGSEEVDTWERDTWQKQVIGTDVLIIQPQLFLDALNALHVDLISFCAVIVHECQHCAGRHPLAKIFSEHVNQLTTKDFFRVLGISSCLVKPKVKAAAEREQVIKKLEKLMNESVLYKDVDDVK